MTPTELRAFLGIAEEAMRDEGVNERTRERVLNRLIWGQPDGYRASIDPEERVQSIAVDPRLWAGDAHDPYRR